MNSNEAQDSEPLHVSDLMQLVRSVTSDNYKSVCMWSLYCTSICSVNLLDQQKTIVCILLIGGSYTYVCLPVLQKRQGSAVWQNDNLPSPH